ncbi:MAG TPA: ATP-grasp domain-containing protein [Jatrophihabitans sp.]|nr:ATP-grasp domain-containing protein [Jatrophihabitans sp.]
MSDARPPHVLLLGGFYYLFARSPGLPLRVTCLRDDPYDEDLALRCIGEVVRADPRDPAAIATVARAVHARDPLDAIVTYHDATMPIAAQVAEDLGIAPAGSAEAWAASTDKTRMRRLLHAAGVDDTPFRRCDSIEQLRQFVAETGPAIVKPVTGSAGRSVTAVAGPDDVPGAWQFVQAELATGGVLAEALLTGQEYSVETLSVQGRHQLVAVTTKSTSGAPWFIELGHAVDLQLPAELVELATRTVTAALDAVGHRSGPCHTEIMVDGGTARVVELNPRVAGDQIWEIVQLATGVDLFAGYLLTAAGLQPPPAWRSAGAAVRFVTAPEAGLAVEYRGVQQARLAPGVVRVVLPELPRQVRPLLSSEDRLGFVVAIGESRDEAAARAEAAAGAVEVVVQA